MTDPETQQAKGAWKQLKGRVREAWGVLSDDDVDRFKGKMDRLAGFIEEKTGENRETIRKKLARFTEELAESEPNRADVRKESRST